MRARLISLPVAFAALFFALLVTPAAQAQRDIDIERFRPALDSNGFLGLQGTQTPGHGRFGVSLFANWSTNSLVLSPPETEVIDNRLQMHAMVQVGLGERWAAGLSVPFVVYQQTDDALLYDGVGGMPSAGTGDPRFVVRYRFFGDGTKDDGSRTEGPGLALQGAVTLPVGDTNGFLGEGKAQTELTALADFHIFGAGVGFGFGWRHRFDPQTFAGVRMRDEGDLALALKLPVPWVTGLFGILEGRATTDAARPFHDTETTNVELDLGARLFLGDFAISLAGGPGLTAGVGTPGFRTILGVEWSPKTTDADLDGITDGDDQCPFLPEDFDQFEDTDGCLDPDNDNDLVPDEDDRCPNVASEEGKDDNEDGCTDPVLDRDKDGITDASDACPGSAEDRDGVEDDDGCAE